MVVAFSLAVLKQGLNSRQKYTKTQMMEKELYDKVVKLLQEESTLSFATESHGQGGIEVRVLLNERQIGEKYTWVPEEKRYLNIPQGSQEELELAKSIEDWVDDFFEYVNNDGNLLADNYDSCEFVYEDDCLECCFSGTRNWDGDEEEVCGSMGIEPEPEYD